MNIARGEPGWCSEKAAAGARNTAGAMRAVPVICAPKCARTHRMQGALRWCSTISWAAGESCGGASISQATWMACTLATRASKSVPSKMQDFFARVGKAGFKVSNKM